MSLVPVTLPAVWDIPVAAGVPALLGPSVVSGARASASTLLASALDEALIAQADRQWGIFSTSNQPVLTSGRVRSVDVQHDSVIAQAPMEQQSFQSYNKVLLPGRYAVDMLCDGSSLGGGEGSVLADLVAGAGLAGPVGGQMVRTAFLATLDALVADVALYTVVTPEAVYANVNVVGYALRREARRGLTLLWAALQLQEVRLNSQTTAADTATPAGQAERSGGNVQAQDASTDMARMAEESF
ncbi:hypothetical protein [Acetobacter vaccinii]|uniref:Uncharacterized protein n=1 Tax=Acetobacter vaccinii TaxID=2592655 RepID=A0A5C1YPR9_9PROT|nr:hypothetical protein [Acetobacter vaccinii]QEO17209.1 hypothetical protein FLP30_05240 [Acetobacter vaccinii]